MEDKFYLVLAPSYVLYNSDIFFGLTKQEALTKAEALITSYRDDMGFYDEVSSIRIYKLCSETLEIKMTHVAESNGRDFDDPECEYRMVEVGC